MSIFLDIVRLQHREDGLSVCGQNCTAWYRFDATVCWPNVAETCTVILVTRVCYRIVLAINVWPGRIAGSNGEDVLGCRMGPNYRHFPDAQMPRLPAAKYIRRSRQSHGPTALIYDFAFRDVWFLNWGFLLIATLRVAVYVGLRALACTWRHKQISHDQ